LANEQINPDTTLAAMKESRRELESLTYTIAHDLRAPLRTIDGFARALSEDCGEKLDEEGRRYLQHVLDAAKRMSEMLEGLLILARIARAELHPGPADLSQMARGIVQRLQAAEPSRSVEAVIPARLAAEGDPDLLATALEALLQNAWKFTRGREPARIELGLTTALGARLQNAWKSAGGPEPARIELGSPSDAPSGAATDPPVYFVRDNGAGFDMRYAAKLFGPFQRLHPEREFEGVGIGLAAAQRIVRRHGGRLWADAAVDKGATLYFTLNETAGSRAS
jgi:light-regulated signal transduction histidine kinase (bacteriophytochrome)